MKPPQLMLKIYGPAAFEDEMSWDLVDAGASAVEQRDQSTMAASPEDDRIELIAGFDDAETRRAAAVTLKSSGYAGIRIEEYISTDESWRHGWRDFFEPVVLETIQIVTPWMDVPPEGRTTIVIDPGQAFGTGGHATTRLILKMIEGRARRGDLPTAILDVGTGSGVLAIAAMKLGVTKVLGIDIEPEAIEAAAENAARNGIESGFSCRVCTAGEMTGTWPLVLANLQLDVFLTAANEIAGLVEPGGDILVSGILLEQEKACLSLWPGFEPVERAEEGEWAALALRRNG